MNILIPINTGTEYRQFVLSGIAEHLCAEGHQIYFTVRDNDPHIIKELEKNIHCSNILKWIEDSISDKKYLYTQRLLDLAYEYKYPRFSYTAKKFSNKTVFKRYVSSLIIKLCGSKLLENYLIKRQKDIYLPNNQTQLKEYTIDLILTNSARRETHLSLYLAALQLNIPIKVLYHTNKAIVADNRISLPFKSLGVWNENMQIEIARKNQRLNTVFSVVGCTQFCHLNGDKYIISREKFNQLYSLKGHEFIILYTAAGPVIENEIIIVKQIIEALDNNNFGEYRIIVRLNPMNTSDCWETLHNHPRVSIQHPKWGFENNFSYALKEDLEEYKSLLKYSDVCVNIPSTVTIEALLMMLPVVNIVYHPEGLIYKVFPNNICDFWYQDYYRIYHNNRCVQPITNQSNIYTVLNDIKENKESIKDYQEALSISLPISPKESFDRAIEFI